VTESDDPDPTTARGAGPRDAGSGAPATGVPSRRDTAVASGAGALPEGAAASESGPHDDRPAHERVYRSLRARILAGGMAPGESVTLRGLAEALEVSMTPAREAVRRLVAERALAMTPSGRVLVPDPTPAALEEVFAARALLEPELARRALPRIGPDRLAALRALDARIDTHMAAGAPSAGAYVAANNRFHAALYEPAQAPALMALVESVWLQTAPVMRRVYARLGHADLVDFHGRALAAIEAGDADALARAIADDVAQGATLLARNAR
jgi:DNA-binding GntR family transcriptional regulator